MSTYTPQTNPVTIDFISATPYTPPTNGTIIMDFANAYDGSGTSNIESSTNFFMML